MAIKIFADSTCDLSKELIDEFGVTIIPLYVGFGSKYYADMYEITPNELFDMVDKYNEIPKTSAVSAGTVADIIGPITASGDDVIMITLSSELSSTFNSANIAAQVTDKAGRFHIIDSKSLSTGSGLLVAKAHKLLAEGKSFEYIVSELEETADRLNVSFVVDTLEYLKLGGRCSTTSAFVGGMMHLHPRLRLKEGKIVSDKKYKGKMSSVVKNYRNDLNNELDNANKDLVFITHTGADKSIIDDTIDYLKSIGFKRICVTSAGCVISSHCGPGTLGILFENKTK